MAGQQLVLGKGEIVFWVHSAADEAMEQLGELFVIKAEPGIVVHQVQNVVSILRMPEASVGAVTLDEECGQQVE